jgi:hypothetical protein
VSKLVALNFFPQGMQKCHFHLYPTVQCTFILEQISKTIQDLFLCVEINDKKSNDVLDLHSRMSIRYTFQPSKVHMPNWMYLHLTFPIIL